MMASWAKPGYGPPTPPDAETTGLWMGMWHPADNEELSHVNETTTTAGEAADGTQAAPLELSGYEEHAEAACRLLDEAVERNRMGQIITARDYVAVAQVHATLAQAAATRSNQAE